MKKGFSCVGSAKFVSAVLSKGFTLIELLVVVLIIGILAAIAVPQYQLAVEKARVKRMFPLFRTILKAQETYKLANPTGTADMNSLDISVTYVRKVEDPILHSYTLPGKQTPVIAIKPSGDVLYYSDRSGINIDFHKDSIGSLGTVVMCYPVVNDTLAERVCKSMGTFSHQTSKGANVYAVTL